MAGQWTLTNVHVSLEDVARALRHVVDCGFAAALIEVRRNDPDDTLTQRALELANAAGYWWGRATDRQVSQSVLIPVWAAGDFDEGLREGGADRARLLRWQETTRPRQRPSYVAPEYVVAENRYFAVSLTNGSAEIHSKCIHGAHGGVLVPPGAVNDVFDAVEGSTWKLSQYLADHYGMVSALGLWRNDDDGRPWGDPDDEPRVASDEFGELALMTDHPAGGTIHFGAVEYEDAQLRALCDLRRPVAAALADINSAEARLAATARAKIIFAMVDGPNFMPSDGYCYCCKCDVTQALMGASGRASITGCPLCGRTWCD